MLKSLSDAPTNLSNPENNSLITELQKYDASIYFSTDENLISKYGRLLFFKENEKDFPKLSEIAKMIFCLVPSSSPVESIFSITGNTQNKLRNRKKDRALNLNHPIMINVNIENLPHLNPNDLINFQSPKARINRNDV